MWHTGGWVFVPSPLPTKGRSSADDPWGKAIRHRFEAVVHQLADRLAVGLFRIAEQGEGGSAGVERSPTRRSKAAIRYVSSSSWGCPTLTFDLASTGFADLGLSWYHNGR